MLRLADFVTKEEWNRCFVTNCYKMLQRVFENKVLIIDFVT